MGKGKPVVTAEELNKRWGKKTPEQLPSAAGLSPKQVMVAAIEHVRHVAVMEQKVNEQAAKLEEVKKYSPLQAQEALAACLQKYGVDPADELTKMAIECDETGKFILTADQRIKIWLELLSYRMPKLKSAQVAGQIDTQMTIVVKKFGSDNGAGGQFTPGLQATGQRATFIEIPSQQGKVGNG